VARGERNRRWTPSSPARGEKCMTRTSETSVVVLEYILWWKQGRLDTNERGYRGGGHEQAKIASKDRGGKMEVGGSMNWERPRSPSRARVRMKKKKEYARKKKIPHYSREKLT